MQHKARSSLWAGRRHQVAMTRHLRLGHQLAGHAVGHAVPADALDRMTDGAMTVTRLLERNVRDVTWQDARDIYQAAF